MFVIVRIETFLFFIDSGGGLGRCGRFDRIALCDGDSKEIEPPYAVRKDAGNDARFCAMQRQEARGRAHSRSAAALPATTADPIRRG
jgi:hypothetical protein